jgi:hypothetical protein
LEKHRLSFLRFMKKSEISDDTDEETITQI